MLHRKQHSDEDPGRIGSDRQRVTHSIQFGKHLVASTVIVIKRRQVRRIVEKRIVELIEIVMFDVRKNLARKQEVPTHQVILHWIQVRTKARWRNARVQIIAAIVIEIAHNTSESPGRELGGAR